MLMHYSYFFFVLTHRYVASGCYLWIGHVSLQWRHNERNGLSNHQPHDCLLNRLFSCTSKKTSKLRVTGLCEGNSPVTGEFPSQRASNAENVYTWWRHHILSAIAVTPQLPHHAYHVTSIWRLGTHQWNLQAPNLVSNLPKTFGSCESQSFQIHVSYIYSFNYLTRFHWPLWMMSRGIIFAPWWFFTNTRFKNNWTQQLVECI